MKLPIGIDKDNLSIVYIGDLDEDQRGLKCNCICPECKTDLVAKMGDIKIKHFSHYREKESSGCQETALHLLGKHVLSKLTSIKIDNYDIEPQIEYDLLGRKYTTDNESIFGSKEVQLLSSELEKKISSVIADVYSVAQYNDIELNINFEIKVWHKVDEIKERKLKELQVNTIEIDLFHLLEEPEVTFDTVKNAIEDPFNQKIVYLTDGLKNKVSELAFQKLTNKVNSKNSEISHWINCVYSTFRESGIKLPNYEYKFKKIQKNRFGAKIKSKLPPEPVLNKTIKVVDFKHVKHMEFNLVLASNQGNKSLPIIINEDYVDDDCIYEDNSLPNYLLMDIKCIDDKDNGLIFKWGRNQLVDDYKKTCNKIIDNEIENFNKYKQKKLEQNLQEVKALIESGVHKEATNIQQIKSLSIANYNELVRKGFTPDFLKTLIFEPIDSLKIFGCPTKLWQMILIRDICWINNDGIDVSFMAKRLEQLDISLVSPYKELMYSSKILKQKDIDMPFVTPYKMLSNFFRHLENQGFLIHLWRGEFSKRHIYGKEYKARKINSYEQLQTLREILPKTIF